MSDDDTRYGMNVLNYARMATQRAEAAERRVAELEAQVARMQRVVDACRYGDYELICEEVDIYDNDLITGQPLTPPSRSLSEFYAALNQGDSIAHWAPWYRAVRR